MASRHYLSAIGRLEVARASGNGDVRGVTIGHIHSPAIHNCRHRHSEPGRTGKVDLGGSICFSSRRGFKVTIYLPKKSKAALKRVNHFMSNKRLNVSRN